MGGQSDRFHGPGGMMISAGATGGPGVGLALGTGAEIVGVKFVEAGMSQPQFVGDTDGAEVSGAEAVEDVTDEWSGQTFAELKFFMAARIAEGRWIYRIGAETGRATRAGAEASPTCRLSGFRGARVASPQSPSLR